MGEPLLGRPVLEALGLDCRKVLAAAADRHGGTIDVSKLVGNRIDFRRGRIGRVLEGIFHADGGADEADLDDDDGWLDLGPEDISEKRFARQRVKECLSLDVATWKNCCASFPTS